ncbi:MAG: Crp/Fnr family transcriptional regulator [Verrucomicrobiae bacterium]|nr:Crp/Fnr family transcriptional regulator [Verrucomicrobiae bacterium]
MSPIASLLALTDGYPLRVYPAGHVLLEEGRRGGVLYVLESGTVEILKAGVAISTVSHPGAVFGEVSSLLNQAPMATVRVTAECRFRVIDEPMAFLRAHPDAAMHVAMLLARRLGTVMEYLAELKRKHESRQDHLAMVDEVLASLLNLHARPRRVEGMAPTPGD